MNEDLPIDAVTHGNGINDTEHAFPDVQVGPNRTAVSFKLDSANVIPTHFFSDVL